MKKLLIAFCATVLAASAWADETSADVLMWSIDTSRDTLHSGVSFDSYKFWAVDSNQNKYDLGSRTFVENDPVPAASTIATSETIGTVGISPAGSFAGDYYTNLSGFNNAGYSFMMELYSGNTRVDRMLNPVNWSELANYVVSSEISSDFAPVASIQPYNFASTMVPEPSGGLLLMLGSAFLALRRRRAA